MTTTMQIKEAHENLKRFLEEKAAALQARDSGSMAIGEFWSAKQACLTAGIPESEVQSIIDDVAERRRGL